MKDIPEPEKPGERPESPKSAKDGAGIERYGAWLQAHRRHALWRLRGLVVSGTAQRADEREAMALLLTLELERASGGKWLDMVLSMKEEP